MVAHSKNVDTIHAEQMIRLRYSSHLDRLQPPVTFMNAVDRETPSLGFQFIDSYVFRHGTRRNATEMDAIMLGCEKCKANMGAQRGCEYTKLCGCLENAEPNEDAMTSEQREHWQHWKERKVTEPDPSWPKRFPYIASGDRTGCLDKFYLESRRVIYECNKKCNCGPKCKNRNVQFGRKVRLEIFKTRGRGFGLRCPEPLRKGQFIDTYVGEVVTDAEADRREEEARAVGGSKGSYLFGLDKFTDGQNVVVEQCFVVDGQFMGGPTRFINHSCDPNVQMHTVSYNKNDYYVYDLAFFAAENIPANTELTFDYLDKEEANNDGDVESSQQKQTRVECRCGAENCRGYLWV